MRFAIPQMLWFLALVPLIGVYLIWANGHWNGLLKRFGTDKALVRAQVIQHSFGIWLRNGLYLLGVFTLVIAMARPQWGFHERRIVSHGVDMMIAIDTSASMMARDFQPTRLARAKELLKNLIWEGKGSRIGIVAFSGQAAVMCPLTLDYDMASTALKAVDVNTVTARGTNIGAAINSALAGFQISGGNDRILILLTDGEQTEDIEGLNAAVDKAVTDGTRIFAIGIGTENGATISTARGPKLDSEGKVVTTSLDFDKLLEIANKTKGVAVKAQKIGAAEIAEVSAQLAKFKGQKQQDKSVRVYHDRYPWFLGIAIFCFVLEALLRSTKGFWTRKQKLTRSPLVIMCMLSVLSGSRDVLAYPGEAYIRSREAFQKFKSGEYDQAFALYKKASELSPQDAQIQYNVGTAAAKANKIDEAKKAFRSVYDPANTRLNSEALFAASTLDHRAVRETIKTKKESWVADLSGTGEASETAKSEIQETLTKLQPIISDYKKALMGKSDDTDIKTNYEIARNEQQELEKLLEEKRQQEQNQQEPQSQEKPPENQPGKNDKDQQGQNNPEEKSEGEGQNQDNPQNQPGKPDEDKQDQTKPDDKVPGEEEKKPEGENDKPDNGNQEPDKQSGKPGDKPQPDQTPDPKGKPTPTPVPSPTPSTTPGSGPGNQKEGPEPTGTPVPIGQMSPTDVDRLLNTLPSEDQQALQLMFGSGDSQQDDMKNDW